MRVRRCLAAAALALALGACGGGGGGAPDPVATPGPTPTPTPSPAPIPAPVTTAVARTVVATFADPWAMVFLPDGRLLVTERGGALRVATTGGQVSAAVAGVPAVVARGQGGLLDVALDPAFATSRRIYLSYAEAGSGGAAGLAVARATLTLDAGGGRLDSAEVIWRQAPKVAGEDRHFGGRMAFAPDGTLYVTAGERHQGSPAQDLSGTLGKIVRINADGSGRNDGPFAASEGAKAEVWTLGHRNPYGLVFASDGRLFESEMGPDSGDEFNLIEGGRNYGWRVVAEGSDGGETLPRHATRPEFAGPLLSWSPNIAPGGMIQYTGARFSGWNGDFVLAGLVSRGIVRVRVSGSAAAEAGRIGLGARIREVEQGPDGAIWVLEDGGSGRLIRLDPA